MTDRREVARWNANGTTVTLTVDHLETYCYEGGGQMGCLSPLHVATDAEAIRYMESYLVRGAERIADAPDEPGADYYAPDNGDDGPAGHYEMDAPTGHDVDASIPGFVVDPHDGVIEMWPSKFSREEARVVVDGVLEARRGVITENVRNALLLVADR